MEINFSLHAYTTYILGLKCYLIVEAQGGTQPCSREISKSEKRASDMSN